MATAKGSVRSPTLPSPSLAHFYDQQARFAPEKKRLLYSTTPSRHARFESDQRSVKATITREEVVELALYWHCQNHPSSQPGGSELVFKDCS